VEAAVPVQNQVFVESPTWAEELPTDFQEPKHDRPRRRWLLTVIGVMLVLAAVVTWRILAKPDAPAYSVAQVRRDDIVKTISATGKLQAVTTVQVGTQVSGVISELHADFNDQVKKGQVIARLDSSQLEGQLNQAKANLQSAQARVQTAQTAILSAEAAVQAAQANVERTDSVLKDAQNNFKRTEELIAAGVAPSRDHDTAQATLSQAIAQRQQAVAQANQAKAQAQSSRSQLDQARAEAQQSSASVQIASVNLDRSVIRAPIDGTVIARNVDVGQTVAASLQAPTIYLIANDLTRMQVLADIDEADVGQLKPESRVSFTVDAFPRDTFQGRISQIRLAPLTVQNVVTYTAVIEVGNPDLKLKPGMTATVTAVVEERKNALMVPSAALRFRPADAPAPPPATSNRQGRGSSVWVVDGDKLKQQRVRAGITDGANTEIIGDNLPEGTRIAIPAQTAGSNRPAATGSPFQMRRGPGGGGGRPR
jgi:HlyD family secretion protein